MRLVENSQSTMKVLNKHIKQQKKLSNVKAALKPPLPKGKKSAGSQSSKGSKKKTTARVWASKTKESEWPEELQEEGGEEESEFEDDFSISVQSSIRGKSVPSHASGKSSQREKANVGRYTDEEWREWFKGKGKGFPSGVFESMKTPDSEPTSILTPIEELARSFAEVETKFNMPAEDPEVLLLKEKVMRYWRTDALPSILVGYHLLNGAALSAQERSAIIATSRMHSNSIDLLGSVNHQQVEKSLIVTWQDSELKGVKEENRTKSVGKQDQRV